MTDATDRKVIRVYDAAGELIAALPRSACKRMSMQAAADHRAMDAYHARNPAAAAAAIGATRFVFVAGQSRMARGQI